MRVQDTKEYRDWLRWYFDVLWLHYADVGYCDALGGKEYERVWGSMEAVAREAVSVLDMSDINVMILVQSNRPGPVRWSVVTGPEDGGGAGGD